MNCADEVYIETYASQLSTYTIRDKADETNLAVLNDVGARCFIHVAAGVVLHVPLAAP